MSEIDTTALSGLAQRRGRSKKTVRFDWNGLHPGRYLAADPSLTGFGLVLLEVDDDLCCRILLAVKIDVPPTPTGTGWEDILTRTEQLAGKLDGHFAKVRTCWPDAYAVHESPPIGHGKLVNREIPLLASREFRRAASGFPMLPMVRRPDHAKLICGNSSASKKEHHAALRVYFPGIDGADLITNEATRDACSVALYAATRGF